MLLESSPSDGMPPEALLPEAWLDEARLKLRAPDPVERPWPALLAAGFFALAAMVFALSAILAPPLAVTPPTKIGVR